jgi:hypothetical protein
MLCLDLERIGHHLLFCLEQYRLSGYTVVYHYAAVVELNFHGIRFSDLDLSHCSSPQRY